MLTTPSQTPPSAFLSLLSSSELSRLTYLHPVEIDVEPICAPRRDRDDRDLQRSARVDAGCEAVKDFVWQSIPRETEDGIEIGREWEGRSNFFGMEAVRRNWRRLSEGEED